MLGKEKTITEKSKEYIRMEVRRRTSYYNERNKLIHELRRMRFMRRDPKAATTADAVIAATMRAPLAYGLVQTMVGAIARERPRFYRESRGDAYHEIDANLAKSSDLLLQTLERQRQKPLFWPFIDQVLGDGLGVLKAVHRGWPNLPKETDYESATLWEAAVEQFVDNRPPLPIMARLVDPLTFMPAALEWGAADPMFNVIEYSKRPMFDAMSNWNLWMKDGKPAYIPPDQPFPEWEPPAGLSATVNVAEYWTNSDVVVVLDNQWVYAFENAYGRLPYVWAYGLPTGLSDPTLEALSVIFPLMYLQPWLDAMLASAASWAYLSSKPSAWVSRDLVAGSNPTVETSVTELKPGMIYDMGVGARMGILSPGDAGTSINNIISTIISLIDRLGISPIASGFISSRMPGLTFTGAMEAATGKLMAVVDNIEVGLAEFIKLNWQIIERSVKAPIYVTGSQMEKSTGRRVPAGWTKIDPKDIGNYYDLSCELSREGLQDEIAKGTHAAFMSRSGLWPKRKAMSYSGLPDPVEAEMEIVADDIRQMVTRAWTLTRMVERNPRLAEILGLPSGPGEPGAPEELATTQEAATAGLEGNPGGPPPRGGGRPAGSPRTPGGPGNAVTPPPGRGVEPLP